MRTFIALLLALIASSVSAKSPLQFDLVYRFTFNGQYIGEVTDSFKRSGSRYQLTSSAKPKGQLALLLPLLKLSSEGEVLAQGLSPTRYQQVQSYAPNKPTIASFDWSKGILTHQYKGKTAQTELQPGTLDALTQLYTFTFMASLPQSIEFPVSNGRKVINYRYEKQSSESINTPMGSFEAVEYRRIAGPDENAISVWIAPKLNNLPLRIRVREDSGTFDQQLIRMNYRST